MTENRYRPSSPQGRRYADPRASTGMVYSTSFDPRYYSQPRSAVDTLPAARHGNVYTTHGAARKTYLDETHPGAASTIRTEYTVRPRNNSMIGSEKRRPVSAFIDRTPSPPRVRPAIVTTSARDDPRSPVVTPASERYLVPAASHSRRHHRQSSATRAEQDLLRPARGYRQPEYHRRGGYNAPLQDEDFSYTTPSEHFLQESSRPPQRTGSYSRRERPTSVLGLPEYRVPTRRDGPPLSSARALDRIERPDPYRSSGPRLRDYEEPPVDVVTRHRSMRAPVVHQHREDGYAPAREERDPRLAPKRHDRLDDDERALKAKYRDDREREPARAPPRETERVRDRDRDREKDRDRDGDRDRLRGIDRNIRGADDRRQQPRSREDSPEHPGSRKGLAAAAGLAAAGALAGAAVKGSKSGQNGSESDDHKDRLHRRRRRHHANDDTSPDDLAGRVERNLTLNNGDRTSHDRRREDGRGGDAESGREDHSEQRKRHRRRHRDRTHRGDESDTTDDSGGREHPARPKDTDRDADLREPHRSRHDRAPSRDATRDAPSVLDQQAVPPGEDEDGRPRRVQLVEPTEKKEDFKPKGILKPPREVPFPEDPHPEREGVAPLKDAHKDGIPPNARWTKISRALVNPEALEKSHERFEERDDYVIVLRVVSREEIMKLAEKTKEIRGNCPLRHECSEVDHQAPRHSVSALSCGVHNPC